MPWISRSLFLSLSKGYSEREASHIILVLDFKPHFPYRSGLSLSSEFGFFQHPPKQLLTALP